MAIPRAVVNSKICVWCKSGRGQSTPIPAGWNDRLFLWKKLSRYPHKQLELVLDHVLQSVGRREESCDARPQLRVPLRSVQMHARLANDASEQLHFGLKDVDSLRDNGCLA